MPDRDLTPTPSTHLEQLARSIRPVAEEAGLRLVVLFGSVARDADEAEDLDLAVDAGRPLDTVELTNRLMHALGRSEVDLVDLRRADPVLLMAVADEGVPLFESEPARFAEFQSLAFRRFHDTRKFRDMEHLEIHERLGHTDVGE